MATFFRIKLSRSRTGNLERSSDIISFRYDPYYFEADITRQLMEFIYYLLFAFMLLQELYAFLTCIRYEVLDFQLPSCTNSKFSYIPKLIVQFLKYILLKIVGGIAKYMASFSTLLTFIGLILNVISIYYWLTFVYVYLKDLQAIDYSDPTGYPGLANVVDKMQPAAEAIVYYRKVSAIMTFIYCLRLVTVMFSFFPKLNNFWWAIIRVTIRNMYFLFFLFIINLGISLFTYFYFGSDIPQFRSMFTSFIVVFGTILGYTDGISLMIDKEPAVATITLEIYYFVVIMILINMFIVYVNNEFKRIYTPDESEDEKMKSKFDYLPFIYFRIRSTLKRLFTVQIHRFFNKKKHDDLINKQRLKILHRRKKIKMYKDVDFDIEFQSIYDVNYHQNNSLISSAVMPKDEIKEKLKAKQFKSNWNFLCLQLLMLLHLIIITALYTQIEPDLALIEQKFMYALKESAIPNNSSSSFDPVPYSATRLKLKLSELLPHIYSGYNESTNRALNISGVYLQTDSLFPVTDYCIEIKNSKVIQTSSKVGNINKIAAYRFVDFDKPIDDQYDFYQDIPDTSSRKSVIFKTGSSEIRPKMEYKYYPDQKTLVTQINSTLNFTDPYFVQVVADDIIGPETKSLSVKSVFLNKLSNFYILVHLEFVRNLGDGFTINYYYNQLDRQNLLTAGGFTFPIAMTLKLLILMNMIYQSMISVRSSFYEYNIWYRIMIEDRLDPYLQKQRMKKNPEFLRKIKSILAVDEILLWATTISYSVFLGTFIELLMSLQSFESKVEGTLNDKKQSYEAYELGIKVVNNRYSMNIFSGIEVTILTIQVILSLRKLKLFKVIMKAFYIILGNLTAVIFIMTLVILSFSFMTFVMLGDRYDLFVDPLLIHKMTGILISLRRLESFTDNFDLFTTLVFLIPYVLLIKYTILYVIIAIIYTSISIAHNSVAKNDPYETEYLSYSEFYQRTLALFGIGQHTKTSYYNREEVTSYINSMNYSTNLSIFDYIVEVIKLSEKKHDPILWSRMMAAAIFQESIDRRRVKSKHDTVIAKLMGFAIVHKFSYYSSFKKSEDNDIKKSRTLKKLLYFYKTFFDYYKYGSFELNKCLMIEVASIANMRRELDKNRSKSQNYKNLLLLADLQTTASSIFMNYRRLMKKLDGGTENKTIPEDGRKPVIKAQNVFEP